MKEHSKMKKHFKRSKDKMEPTQSQDQSVIGNLGSNRRTIKKSKMIIVVAVFAVLGVVTLIFTHALTPANGDFEAETMTTEAL